MKRTSVLISLAALGLSGAASSQTLEITESAHELTLSNVILPSSTAGTLIYKSCAECDSVGAQVRQNTRYVAPAGEMALADFREYIIELNATNSPESEIYVTVFRSVADGTVSRVKVHAPD